MPTDGRDNRQVGDCARHIFCIGECRCAGVRGLDDLERWLNFGEQATERGDQKLQADDAEHRREGPDFSDAERHLLLIAVDIMDRRVQRYLKVGSLQERVRSEEHTSELQSLMRISYAVFCLKKKKNKKYYEHTDNHTIKPRTSHSTNKH